MLAQDHLSFILRFWIAFPWSAGGCSSLGHWKIMDIIVYVVEMAEVPVSVVSPHLVLEDSSGVCLASCPLRLRE